MQRFTTNHIPIISCPSWSTAMSGKKPPLPPMKIYIYEAVICLKTNTLYCVLYRCSMHDSGIDDNLSLYAINNRDLVK